MKLFGVSELAARLPAALSSLLTTWFIWFAGCKWFNRRAGLLSAAIYATAPMTVLDARQMTTDSLLVCALTIALVSFWQSGAHAANRTVNRRYVLLFWAMCGVAVLIKGAVGLLLPVMIIVVNVVFEKLRFRFRWAGRAPGELAIGARWNRFAQVRPVIGRLQLLIGLIVVLLVAAPWHLAILKTHNPDAEGRNFVQEYIVRQHIGRFRGGDTVHNAPIYTYFLYFLVGFFPWACFAPTAFRNPEFEGSRQEASAIDAAAAAQEGEHHAFPWPSVIHSSRPEDDKHRFLLVWFWTIFTFFSISAAKLPTYIVPAYPAAALLIGSWFDICLNDATRFRALLRAVRGVTAVAGLLAGVACFAPTQVHGKPLAPPDVVSAVRIITLTLLAGGGAAWVAMSNGEVARWRQVGIAALIACMTLVVLEASTLGYSVADRFVQSPFQQAAVFARKDAAAGIPVVFYNISPRLPSMLYYAETYSPIERKETPLLPYLEGLRHTGYSPDARGVDVALAKKSLETQLKPEADKAGWTIEHLYENEGFLVVRLVRSTKLVP
jgi:4-amino-4-deoxy-L-arabinose transferase-like glycosyltransferase